MKVSENLLTVRKGTAMKVWGAVLITNKRYGYGEGEFIELSINLKHYSTEEVLNYISAYYKDLKEIEEIYGQDKNWIIAECIFEQSNGLY